MQAGLAVEPLHVGVERSTAGAPDIPGRVLDSVLDGAAVRLPRVTPVMLGDESFLRAIPGVRWLELRPSTRQP
jgi:hypothetical protein